MSGTDHVSHEQRAELSAGWEPPGNADQELAGSQGLWPGDTGELPAQVRRVLVELVRGPYVSQVRTPNLWATLVAHEGVVRSRLADLFLDLAIDADAEIAFARNATSEEVEVPAMMRRAPLNFIDTALLLYLRQLVLRAAARGERAFVGMDEIIDHLSQYQAPGSTDRALVAKRARASVKRMKDFAILDTTDTQERFEVMAILTLIVTPEVVEGLEAEYRRAMGDPGILTGLEVDLDAGSQVGRGVRDEGDGGEDLRGEDGHDE